MPAQPRFDGGFERVVRAVVVVDVVESVRLIHEDETNAVQRWRVYAAEATDRIAPAYGGRVVKSLGDGLMMEFPAAPSAVLAAFELQRLSLATSEGLEDHRKMRVRVGVHVSPLISDARDVYGHGVNLTARLASLAGPDEIVVSADVRDQLVADLDAEIEDLGECYLKHLEDPVRAFRIGAPGERPALETAASRGDLKATVAVMPFSNRGSGAQSEHDVIGQALVDDVIAALSRSPEINVVSRLSTTAFRGRKMDLDTIALHLHADYVVSGSLAISGGRLRLNAELAEVRSSQVIWSKTLKGAVAGVIAGEDDLADRLVSEISMAMSAHEVQRATGKALPTLESRTLLLAGITLMHRISPTASQQSRLLLQTLIDRAPRLAAPYAWLAKWHVLRVTQGWSDDVMADGKQALDNTRRALDRDSTLSLAMVVEGQVNTYILKNLDVAEERYEAALRENPNDSLGWLLKGTLHAFRDEGQEAVRHTRQAMKLSPLDPLKYYFDSLGATASLASGQYPRAVNLAQASLRLNRTHASTLRVLITALWQLGREEEARKWARELLKIDPTFKVSTYLERSPAAPFKLARTVASAMQSAGIPR
ncbi:adenylate/guanylate cyclase domain-containing protein [Variovorax sp. J22R115]|uniref:tetratricopeptide repeat protein n=1 Tax=Variovorax sp. J22R115 TaxID=3053509 RepID=UPI0025772603|nr:adenylate/guanylate cyclase domain-containing protein [Variovorax sp. J22R115]MDM0048190.1 adenylate/guanylate cyclase domain-containing protein [Variovorax sp. J22R115]